MFEKKFKVRIIKATVKYRVEWAEYRLFPDWTPLEKSLHNIGRYSCWLGNLGSAIVLAESIKSVEDVNKHNQYQRELFKKEYTDKLNYKTDIEIIE